MKYQSQKVALAYFACAMALFAAQVLFGLLVGYIYVAPNFLSELVPFNVARMIHTNPICRATMAAMGVITPQAAWAL